jgi:hypothetical protein
LTNPLLEGNSSSDGISVLYGSRIQSAIGSRKRNLLDSSPHIGT